MGDRLGIRDVVDILDGSIIMRKFGPLVRKAIIKKKTCGDCMGRVCRLKFISLKCGKSFAPGEARTHGLQIMRLTRCLLRYGGNLFIMMIEKVIGSGATIKKKFLSEVGFEPTPSYEDQNSLSHFLLRKQGKALSLAP